MPTTECAADNDGVFFYDERTETFSEGCPMSFGLNRRMAAWLAAATLGLGALSGCTVGDWNADAPPAAGVSQETTSAKIRNVMVVADDQGQAIVLGAVYGIEALELGGIQVAAEAEDGQYGMPVNVETQASIGRGKMHVLSAEETQFENPELQLGRLAQVTLIFSNGEQTTLQAPVYSYEHTDYAETFAEVYG